MATAPLKHSGETPQPPQFIAVEGPVGVGKTTLARRLAHHFGHQLLLEAPEQNPFLERFYQDPRQAALATQLFFLFQRTQQMHDLHQTDLFQPAWVADFLIAKDRLFAHVNLDADEYALYEQVYQRMTIDAPRPDLVIYLQAPTDVLISRIQQRGIGYEQAIERQYLDRINAAYSDFFLHYDDSPLLIINAAQTDFAGDERDFQELVSQALATRNGRHYFNPSFFQ